MLFSSSIFLLYFLPVFLLTYHLSPKNFKNYIVLLFSIIFYSWGAPIFIFFLLGSCAIDFQLSKKYPEKSGRKNLWLSLIMNIGLLGYFKYVNFFIENINLLLSYAGIESIAWTSVLLPIGISFFTFQKISYILDVYWGKSKPLQKFSDYLLYISLFPQLIAGPIVRYNDIADQITDRKSDISFNSQLNGIFRFVVGLAKKVLISNALAEQVELIHSLEPEYLTCTLAWFAAICYTFHIYYDFSGYSDMAIGLGKMIGFKFPENFNFPYLSRSITEFWQRWHITLGTWMRDYLYIPLGGNKKGFAKTLINLGLVFLLSGLWHGAAWNFALWGLFHGSFLILERLFFKKILDRIPSFIAITYVFLVVLFGWVLFASTSLNQLFLLIGKMFEFNVNFSEISVSYKFVFFFSLAIIGSFIGINSKNINKINHFQNTIQNQKNVLVVPLFIIVIFILTLCIGDLLAGTFNPFIYYRF